MLHRKRRITKAYWNLARRQYLPLIHKLSSSIGIDYTHSQELRYRADEEVLRCMICYNGTGSFMTFLYCRLTGVFKHMRDSENRSRRISSTSPEAMSDIAYPDQDSDTHIMVQECMGCLDTRERHVITELFLNEKSMREVSNNRGVVASTICRIKSRALNKMRQKHTIGLE